MPATLNINGTAATVQNGRWACANPTYLKLLNTTVDPLGPGGDDPHPDLTLAKKAATLFGKSAKLESSSPIKTGRVDTTIIP